MILSFSIILSKWPSLLTLLLCKERLDSANKLATVNGPYNLRHATVLPQAFPPKVDAQSNSLCGSLDLGLDGFYILCACFSMLTGPFLWDRETIVGICKDADTFYFISGLLSTITIVVVLLSPLPIIWKLQVSNLRKLGLAFSFTAGALYAFPLPSVRP